LYCIAVIYFYSASHGLNLSEALPTTAIDTVPKFTRRSATDNCKWRTCPRSLYSTIRCVAFIQVHKYTQVQLVFKWFFSPVLVLHLLLFKAWTSRHHSES